MKETFATRMQIVTELSLRDAGSARAKLVGKETGEAVLMLTSASHSRTTVT